MRKPFTLMLIQAIPDDILGVTQVKSGNRFFRPESVEKGDLYPLPAFSIYQLSSIIFTFNRIVKRFEHVWRKIIRR